MSKEINEKRVLIRLDPIEAQKDLTLYTRMIQLSW